MDDELLAEINGDSFHSLLVAFADTSAGGPSNVLLQENGSAILQEDGSYILL